MAPLISRHLTSNKAPHLATTISPFFGLIERSTTSMSSLQMPFCFSESPLYRKRKVFAACFTKRASKLKEGSHESWAGEGKPFIFCCVMMLSYHYGNICQVVIDFWIRLMHSWLCSMDCVIAIVFMPHANGCFVLIWTTALWLYSPTMMVVSSP